MTQTICMMNFENKINRYSQTDYSSFTHLRQRFTQTTLAQQENRSTQTNQDDFQQPNALIGQNTRESKTNMQNNKYQNKNLIYKGDNHELNEISDVSFSGDNLPYQTNRCMGPNNTISFLVII